MFYPVPFGIIIACATINQKRSRNLPDQSLVSCFCNHQLCIRITNCKTMITLFVEENNPLTPDFYNNLIANLQFHQLRCSCGQAGCLAVHGYYHRYVKSTDGNLCFRICRVKCEACGTTHALLLSSMVPYSQTSLRDQLAVIDAYEADAPTASGLRCLGSVDESCFRYVIRQYTRYWQQRLLSQKISIHPPASLIRNCFLVYSRQFMQIRCTPNIIFSYTT